MDEKILIHHKKNYCSVLFTASSIAFGLYSCVSVRTKTMIEKKRPRDMQRGRSECKEEEVEKNDKNDKPQN